MKDDQKLLAVSGISLIIFSIIYLSVSGVPNDKGTALLFPLSILALFFGLGFLIWVAGWLLLDKVSK